MSPPAAELQPRSGGPTSPSKAELIAEATAIRTLGATVVNVTDIGTHAVELAVNNWAVFPLRGKIPAIPGGRGVLDATTDIETIAAWWGGRYAGCNIGARVPESMFVLDVDNLDALAEIEKHNGKLPETLTTISGRAAGGKHLYFRRPHGKITHRRLPKGLEIKTSTGYTVQPPSIHPDTGQTYTRIEAPVAAPPPWLVDLLLPERMIQQRPPRRHLYAVHSGPSVAKRELCSALLPGWWSCTRCSPSGCRYSSLS